MPRVGRLLAALALVAAAQSSGIGQEPADAGVPFGCEPGAVSIDISRQPGVRFVPSARPEPTFPEAREFTFSTGPIRRVRLFLWASLPEGGVGRGSEATLQVVAETSASADPAVPTQWWRLEPAAVEAASALDRAGETLRFDAKLLAPCFSGEPCSFADVTPAADAATALLVLGFTRDLGGANANNWEHGRLVLDFRAATPRVAVAATCGYNEGGGACTAIDSGNMARSDLSCPWDAAAGDFACSEESDQWGHRDFHLLAGTPRSGRDGEVATLHEAARRLAAGTPGPIVVTGLSPVRLVHETAIGTARVVVVAAGGRFYVADRTTDAVGPLRPVAPHGLGLDLPDEPRETPGEGWTGRNDPVFDATEVSRHGATVVLRVTESVHYGDQPPVPPHTLYWLGIERGHDGLRADALTLVAPGAYAWCGQDAVPAVVSAIRRIGRPFDAAVTVQPPTATNLEGEVVWRGAEHGDDVAECRRPGRVRWRDGRFDVVVEGGACVAPQPALYVDLAPDGSIRTSPTVREP